MTGLDHFWQLHNNLKDWCSFFGYELVTVKEWPYKEGYHKIELIIKDPAPPPVLGVNVGEAINTEDKFGG